ncbi:metallophosphoesterase family protein [Arenicella xantha]|uniref:Calcineurin-like phosphoesterase family protein n=1 Tax=Arenicella xantha TaxID=644221 RepID=A0A395JI39_9GAMM|nr:metallophosphoesterase [Arenicella xantha]RBP49797.1 calcineurin-like phosphoesterase family protein [Arenicella xantha]
MTTRRNFLVSGAVLATGLGYCYQRGLRYPRLSFEPRALSSNLNQPEAAITLADAISLPDLDRLAFRAIAPSPKITLELNTSSLHFSLNNVVKTATLNIQTSGNSTVEEEVQGITRILSINGQAGQTIDLQWHANLDDGLDFAIIGDTGGGQELDWCLQRASEIDAQFLLHLGDFNYTDGEYTRAIEQFHQAPLPCYVTIGNHDFNDSGLVYSHFLRNIGPLNNYFELAGTRFINIDTAADFFPAQAGLRGNMLRSLSRTSWHGDNSLLFTHSPLRDPRPMDDHEVGGINEVAWLSDMATKIDAENLLCGHVHHSAELDINGLHQWTIGEGLGHEDLIHQQQVASMLMGRVEPGRPVDYRWIDLAMPWRFHTSPTHAAKLTRDKRTPQLEWYKSILSSTQPI